MTRNILLFTVTLLIALQSFSQSLDHDFIVNEMKRTHVHDKIDEVKVFFVNANYFEDKEKLNAYLKRFTSDRILTLTYLPIDEHPQPGKGSIGIRLIAQRSTEDIQSSLEDAKDFLSGAQAQSLVVNDRTINTKDLNKMLSTLRADEIFDIWRDIGEGATTIKIWTKSYAKEKRW